MVHMLSGENRSEFLAVPQLVRFSMAIGAKGPEPSLLIKANSLSLRYMVRLRQLSLIFLSLNNGWLAYGVEFQDDPAHPAVIWSLLETDEEAAAMMALGVQSGCVVHLFNELAINVATAEVGLSLRDQTLAQVTKSSALHPPKDSTAFKEVREKLSAMRLGTTPPNKVFRVMLPPITDWQEITSTYITNRITRSVVSIFNSDEGGQQEEVALWLIDNLQPEGATKQPTVHVPGRPARELSDLMLSYDNGTFLIESKVLALMARARLPDRAKLTRDVVKEIPKATRQLAGGIRNLRLGHSVTDDAGLEIEVERVKPVHAIILVPDLGLLNEATEFGGEFIQAFCRKNGSFLHFLDPAELLRVVQAAEMLSERSQNLSKMQCLDYYLMERVKRAAATPVPAFHMLLRFTDEAPTQA